MRPPVRARVVAGLLAAALVPVACGGSEPPVRSEQGLQEGSGGPEEIPWDRLPVTDRALDPELTPPEVLEGLGNGRIFVANDGEWEPGTTFRLQTDLGISLQVDLAAGFSDGYVVLTPPESTWLLQIGDEEEEDTWTTVAEVPAARRTETGAIVVALTTGGAVVEPVSVEEFERRVDAAAVHLPSG